MAEALSSDKSPRYPQTTVTNQHLSLYLKHGLIAIVAISLNIQHSVARSNSVGNEMLQVDEALKG